MTYIHNLNVLSVPFNSVHSYNDIEHTVLYFSEADEGQLGQLVGSELHSYSSTENKYNHIKSTIKC